MNISFFIYITYLVLFLIEIRVHDKPPPPPNLLILMKLAFILTKN